MITRKLKSVCLAMATVMTLTSLGFFGCGANDEAYQLEQVEPVEKNELTGLRIAYLGSSVFQGTENNDVSFIEYIAKRNEGTYIKDTVPDSTMADTGEDSYIPRLLEMDPKEDIDIFVCELPWADVNEDVEPGQVSETEDLESLDTTTTIGAMEYIAGYVRQTWNCPVMFFTSPKYENNDKYGALVQAVWQMKDKWGANRACAWFLLNTDIDEIDEYMADSEHPTGKGYLEWLTPFVEEKLVETWRLRVNIVPEYQPENVAKNASNILTGKNIAYLGSSVTFGSASEGISFADYIAARNDTSYIKEAVPGTTLVDNGEQSYIQRMINNISPDEQVDLFVCQLSTNDASAGNPMGEISDSQNLEDFNTGTIIGALEYILTYVKQTWDCPIMFYTGTKYDSEAYGQMVEALKQLQGKYEFGIIDMWDDLDADISEYDEYMSDGIHPNRKGYLEWWTPFMEEKMIEYLTQEGQ